MKVVIAAALFLCSSTGLAQAVPAHGQAETKPVSEKKTCRSLMPTGSLLSTRVCNTAAAWRKFDGITAVGAEQFRNSYRMTTTGLGQNPG
jgi:hypothetical protein